MNSCQSCGMPMEKPDDYGGGNTSSPYCKHCTDAQGNLLPRETVRQNMINFYNKTMGQTQEQAAVEVDKIMAKTPAWQGQTQSVTPATDGQIQKSVEPPVAEPSPAPEPEVPAEVPSEPPVPPVTPTDQSTEPSVPEPTVPVSEPTTPGQPVEPSEAVEPVVPTQPEKKTPIGQGGTSS